VLPLTWPLPSRTRGFCKSSERVGRRSRPRPRNACVGDQYLDLSRVRASNLSPLPTTRPPDPASPACFSWPRRQRRPKHAFLGRSAADVNPSPMIMLCYCSKRFFGDHARAVHFLSIRKSSFFLFSASWSWYSRRGWAREETDRQTDECRHAHTHVHTRTNAHTLFIWISAHTCVHTDHQVCVGVCLCGCVCVFVHVCV